jgi:hypothetical protein
LRFDFSRRLILLTLSQDDVIKQPRNPKSLRVAFLGVCCHIVSHTLTHSHTHTLTLTHTHSHSHTYSHSHSHTLTHTHSHSITNSLTRLLNYFFLLLPPFFSFLLFERLSEFRKIDSFESTHWKIHQQRFIVSLSLSLSLLLSPFSQEGTHDKRVIHDGEVD